MAETYFPFDAGPGAGVTEAQWMKMAALWRGDGVIFGLLNHCAVSGNGSGMHVFVATGVAWHHGFYYENTASITLPVAAADAQDRIDRVVLRLDTTANTITAKVIKGVAAGSPVEPALSAGPTLFDIPLASVAVAAGAVNIDVGDVTDERSWSRSGPLAMYSAGAFQHMASALGVTATGTKIVVTPSYNSDLDKLTFSLDLNDGPGSGVDADTLDGHDSAYFLAAAALTKAAIDALNVDADTLDGHDSAYFLAAAALTKAAIDALNVDADTLDGIDSAGFVNTPDGPVSVKRITAVSVFDGAGNASIPHGLAASDILAVSVAWFYSGDSLWRFATVTSWDDTDLNVSAGTVNASGRNAIVTIWHI